MAQKSRFWDTAAGLGDGADTYSAFQVREFLRAAFTTDRYNSEGVLAGVINKLEVTGSTSPLSVNTGAALVNGIYCSNDASVSVTVPTPGNGTTGHRVVLQTLWSTQTVRVALISSADGVATLPALTQSENSRWEIGLASLTITTDGAITLADTRDYCHYAMAQVHKRKGGSSTSWNTAGSNNYNVGGVKVLCGTATLEWDDEDESDTKTVNFPSAYTQKPLVYVTLINGGDATKRKLLATVESISASSFVLRGQRTDGSSDLTTTADVFWRSKGSG